MFYQIIINNVLIKFGKIRKKPLKKIVLTVFIVTNVDSK